jgi:cell division FtsZ-interacting protein ZapD
MSDKITTIVVSGEGVAERFVENDYAVPRAVLQTLREAEYLAVIEALSARVDQRRCTICGGTCGVDLCFLVIRNSRLAESTTNRIEVWAHRDCWRTIPEEE